MSILTNQSAEIVDIEKIEPGMRSNNPLLSTAVDLGGRRLSSSPTATLSDSGTYNVYGFIQDGELDLRLSGIERYRFYADVINDVTVISASVKYFTDLIGNAQWSFIPSDDDDEDGSNAKWFEKALTKDSMTSFPDLNKQMAMANFYGFALHEKIAKMEEDKPNMNGNENESGTNSTGSMRRLTMKDLKQIPQKTIYRWLTDPATDEVMVIVQLSNQNFIELPIPRDKCLYVKDNDRTDNPEGNGLLRLVASDAKRLQFVERILTQAIQTDIRGIPIGRAPLAELQAKFQGNPTELKKQLRQMENVMKSFKTGKNLRSLLLDSEGQVAKSDPTKNPIATPKWGLEIVKGESSGMQEVLEFINMLKRDISRVFGTESMFLGDGTTGSYALAQDKTGQFMLQVESQLRKNAQAIQRDVFTWLADLNNIPHNLIPSLEFELPKEVAMTEITTSIKDLATAGIKLNPESDAVKELFAKLGLDVKDEDLVTMEQEEEMKDKEMERTMNINASKPEPKGPMGAGGR